VIDLTNLRPGSGGRECSVQLRMPRLREAVGQTSGQAAVAAVTASRPTDCRRTVWEHGSYCCCCCCCCRRRRVGCFESPSRGGHPACARDGCAAAWRRSRAPSAWRPLASSCSSTSGTDSLPWRVAAASMSMCRRPRDSADSHTSIVHTGIPADAYCTVYSATAVVQVQDLTLIRFIAACHLSPFLQFLDSLAISFIKKKKIPLSPQQQDASGLQSRLQELRGFHLSLLIRPMQAQQARPVARAYIMEWPRGSSI
jgi:hypothetical protein